MKRPDPRSAGIYVRRSHAADNVSRSLTEQTDDCLALAERHGLSVSPDHRWAEKEGTGASRHSRKARPQWAAALAALDSGEISTLIVWELSRADRRGAAEIGALLDKHQATGRRILSVGGEDTSDKRQRMAIVLKGEMAREEAENTSIRVRRTKLARRAAGRWLGGVVPLGLRAVADTSGRRLEIDPETYPLARRIADALLRGDSTVVVARALNAEGIPAQRGGKWHAQTIRMFIRQPSIAGLQGADNRRADADGGGWRRHAGEVMVRDDGSPVLLGDGKARIITPAERARILALLDGRSTATGMMRKVAADGRARRGVKPASTLLGGVEGVLRCGTCGGRMQAAGTADGPIMRYYRCADAASSGRSICTSPATVPIPDADRAVTAAFLLTLRAEPAGSPLLTAVAKGLAARTHPNADADRRSAMSAFEDARAEVARIEDLVMDGVISPERARERLDRAHDSAAAAERALASLPTFEVAGSDLVERLDAWLDLDLTERRTLLATAIDRVVASKVGRGRRVPMNERLTVEWAEAVTPQTSPLGHAVYGSGRA